jgi:hypothetical protein
MTQHTTVTAITIAFATWGLSACSLSSPDANKLLASHDTPRLIVERQSLPHGHPPVPGFSSPLTLPEGHPPVPGFEAAPALPEGHPRCPTRGFTESPPSDAGLERLWQSPPKWIST